MMTDRKIVLLSCFVATIATIPVLSSAYRSWGERDEPYYTREQRHAIWRDYEEDSAAAYRHRMCVLPEFSGIIRDENAYQKHMREWEKRCQEYDRKAQQAVEQAIEKRYKISPLRLKVVKYEATRSQWN